MPIVNTYQFGMFRLEVSERRLLREGAEIPLRLKVFDTLCVLVENAGRLVTKEELLQKIWPNTVVEENNLNHNISTIRKALGEKATGQSFIETVPRVGYRFVAPTVPLGPSTDTKSASPDSERNVSEPPRQQIRFCTAPDGVRIAYSTVGSGYPLLKAANWLNHIDLEWNSPVWRHWIRELGARHSFIRYDERGNGLSDWNVPDMSFEAWVRDLETVVEAAGVEQFALMGISQGASVAVAYTVRHPERVSHLILLGGYSRGWEHRGRQDAIEARRALKTLVRLDWGKQNPAFARMFASAYIPEATSPDHESWLTDLQHISTSPENAAAIMDTCDVINVRELLPRVRRPTLVFHCDRDRVIPAEEGRILASEIPDARFVPLSGANHLILEEEPAWRVFLQEVGSFLGWPSR